MNWSLPGSSISGIFQARVLEWVAISVSKGGCNEIAFSEGKRRRSFFQVAVSGWEKQRNGYRMRSGGCRESGPPEKSVVPSTRFLERLNCLC